MRTGFCNQKKFICASINDFAGQLIELVWVPGMAEIKLGEHSTCYFHTDNKDRGHLVLVNFEISNVGNSNENSHIVKLHGRFSLSRDCLEKQ